LAQQDFALVDRSWLWVFLCAGASLLAGCSSDHATSDPRGNPMSFSELHDACLYLAFEKQNRLSQLVDVLKKRGQVH
jgi:hypothetical protein